MAHWKYNQPWNGKHLYVRRNLERQMSKKIGETEILFLKKKRKRRDETEDVLRLIVRICQVADAFIRRKKVKEERIKR